MSTRGDYHRRGGGGEREREINHLGPTSPCHVHGEDIRMCQHVNVFLSSRINFFVAAAIFWTFVEFGNKMITPSILVRDAGQWSRCLWATILIRPS